MLRCVFFRAIYIKKSMQTVSFPTFSAFLIFVAGIILVINIARRTNYRLERKNNGQKSGGYRRAYYGDEHISRW